jgi:hypothetical protein
MLLKTLSRVSCAENAEVLHAIRDKAISIAIWERRPLLGLRDISLEGVRKVRFTESLGELPAQLERELKSAGLKKCAQRDLLAADIETLAQQYGDVLDLSAVEIRLEHVITNACKKFHGDHVTARLICTYVGPGTQWLDGEDAKDCGCGDPHNIQQMNAGDVALLKGRVWSEEHPAIHRSPPIEGTREERLVLVINPPVQM